MKRTQTEIVGKVFVAIRGERRCLICNDVFTLRQAARHATEPCDTQNVGREAVPMTCNA